MPETSGTVTEWLTPNQPLALWWQRNYPGLRHVSRELAARVNAARTSGQDSHPHRPALSEIPVDTPDLRYYDYGLLGGAIDYRMRMEFTPQWGGNPARSAFTRAWAGKRGSLAHAAAALLADCAPVLAQAGQDNLTESLPALSALLEEQAARLDELAPWEWTGPYGIAQGEEPWLLDYCIVLAELDNFYRSWGARLDFTPLLSLSGYRSAQYASGRQTKSGFWGTSSGDFEYNPADGQSSARQIAAAQVVGELEIAWPPLRISVQNPYPCSGGTCKHCMCA